MFQRAKEMLHFKIYAVDGEIGRVEDLYVDDAKWMLRYVVVNTGHWLPGRLVLVSPESISEPNGEKDVLPVGLTCQTIQDSPPIQSDQPVSLQHEQELMNYYGWRPYWGAFGMNWLSGAMIPTRTPEPPQDRSQRESDAGLRSIKELLGYRIQSVDGHHLGHVEDFVIEMHLSHHWDVRYLLIDTRDWMPGGKKLLSAMTWIDDVDWLDRTVRLHRTAEDLQRQPAFDLDAPLDEAVGRQQYEGQSAPSTEKAE